MFIRKDGKYLVLRRSPLKKYAPDVVHPFGGKVDLGEDPYTAAVREVYEETGLTIKNLRLKAVLFEKEPILGEPYNWQIFHFVGDYDAGELQATEEGEAIMLTADAIKAEKLFPSLEPVIEHILNEAEGTVFAWLEYDADKKKIVKQTLNYCAR